MVGGKKEEMGGTYVNSVVVSSDGIVWEASLPPMTYARSSAAVVNAGSPECLVVAGGYRDNTVEILREEQWSVVEPVPKCNFYDRLKCVCHRDVFFVAGEGSAYGKIYYCYLNSLLAAPAIVPGEEPTTNLWKQLDCRIRKFGIASFGGYLVVWTDHEHFYAYSPFSQSWTCVGDLPCSLFHTLMIDGELVFMEHRGMVVKASLRGM